MKQPDFGAAFHAREPRKITYALRTSTPMLTHDLSYLASYLHDAHFRPSDMARRGKTLTIAIERDSWELYRHLNTLYPVNCVLTMTHVAGCTWQFGHDFDDPTGGLNYRRWLMINRVVLVGPDSGSGDAVHLDLYCPYSRWRLSVTFEDEASWRVNLRDLEIPHARAWRSMPRPATNGRGR